MPLLPRPCANRIQICGRTTPRRLPRRPDTTGRGDERLQRPVQLLSVGAAQVDLVRLPVDAETDGLAIVRIQDLTVQVVYELMDDLLRHEQNATGAAASRTDLPAVALDSVGGTPYSNECQIH